MGRGLRKGGGKGGTTIGFIGGGGEGRGGGGDGVGRTSDFVLLKIRINKKNIVNNFYCCYFLYKIDFLYV